MKYSLPKKIIYSIIVAVLLVGLVLTAFFGLNGKGYGSTYDIDLGLDLAGGVSITYQIKEDNFTSQDVEDTIYKLQKRVEGKSTESQVYKEGDNRITVEIPGVTDANEILKELGTPGSLEFLDSTGYTAFSQGNDYTPLLTGSDVKAAQAYTDTNSTDDTPYGVQLTFTDDGATKFYDATSANIGNRIYIVYDGEVVSAPNVKTLRTGYTRTQPLARTSDRKRRMPQGGKRRGAEDPQRRRRFARLLHRVGGFHRRRPRHAAWRDLHSGRPADLLRSENG